MSVSVGSVTMPHCPARHGEEVSGAEVQVGGQLTFLTEPSVIMGEE